MPEVYSVGAWFTLVFPREVARVPEGDVMTSSGTEPWVAPPCWCCPSHGSGDTRGDDSVSLRSPRSVLDGVITCGEEEDELRDCGMVQEAKFFLLQTFASVLERI